MPHKNFGHQQNMGAIVTNNRHIDRLNKLQESDDYQGRFKAEIDTRADTVCAGQGFALIHQTGRIADVRGFALIHQTGRIADVRGFALIHQTGRIADVSGFHSDLGAITGVPIAQVATVYDSADQETLILVFNEALYFGKTTETSLIPP